MAGKEKFTIETVFRAIDRVTRPVGRIGSGISRMARNAERRLDRLNQRMDRTGRAMKRGAMIGAVAVGALSAAYGDAIKTGATYEQSLVSAAARFPGMIRKGTKEFEMLDAAARKAGRTTEFTAGESANAIKYLAMAGFEAQGAIGALPTVIDLATSAEMDLAAASDVATDSLGAFRLLTKDPEQLSKNLTRVADVFAAATNSSNMSVAQLFEAVGKGGPVMAAVGRDVEMFAAMAGTLANSTIKATEAGTSLRNFMLRLTATTPEADKVLRRLGVTVRDRTTGDMMPLFGIIDELNTGLNKLGTADRARAMDVIFGKKAIAGASVLLAAGGDQLRAYREELAASGGANKKLASVIRDTLMGDLKGLNSAIESVKISIARMNEGPLRDAVKRTTDWIRANEQLIADKAGGGLLYIMDNLDGIVSKGMMLSKVVTGVFALVAAVKVATAAVAAFNMVMTLGPVGGVLAMVLALTTALGALAWKFDIFNTSALAVAAAGGAPIMGLVPGRIDPAMDWNLKSRMVPDSELYSGGDPYAPGGPGFTGPQPKVWGPEPGGPSFIGPPDPPGSVGGSAEIIIRDETGRAEFGREELENTRLRLKGTWEF